MNGSREEGISYVLAKQEWKKERPMINGRCMYQAANRLVVDRPLRKTVTTSGAIYFGINGAFFCPLYSWIPWSRFQIHCSMRGHLLQLIGVKALPKILLEYFSFLFGRLDIIPKLIKIKYS